MIQERKPSLRSLFGLTRCDFLIGFNVNVNSCLGDKKNFISVLFEEWAGEEVEDVTSVLVAYRHFWNESLRSTVLYGKVEGDASDRERTQWGVNLFQDLTKELAVGIEVGNFSIDELDKDSNYVQATMRYML